MQYNAINDKATLPWTLHRCRTAHPGQPDTGHASVQIPNSKFQMRYDHDEHQMYATRSIHPIEKLLLVILFTSIPVMASAVYYLDVGQIQKLVSEDGSFEIMAASLWFVLAFVCIRNLGYAQAYPRGLAALSVIFGARELDLHRRLTADSILKINYYRMTNAPLAEKLAAGLVATATLLLIGWLLIGALRYFVRTRAWHMVWGRLVILSSMLLVLAKMFDSAPRTLHEVFDITLGLTARLLLAIHEEWFESLAPLIFCLAVFFWAKIKQPGSAARSVQAPVGGLG